MTAIQRMVWLTICNLLVLTTTTTSISSMDYETPLMFIYNIFTEDIAVRNHTIHSEEVSNPVECFRRCAKVCGCVAFQVTDTSCDLLGCADRDLVIRQGTRLYTIQQTNLEVRSLQSLNSIYFILRLRTVTIFITTALPFAKSREFKI